MQEQAKAEAEERTRQARLFLQAQSARADEVRQATAAYPKMEIGSAYKLWKEARGETATTLSTRSRTAVEEAAARLAGTLSARPCTREGCSGTQQLENICGGCIEGQAGYKTKWTCKTCLHRDLSKEDFNAWMQRLSSV